MKLPVRILTALFCVAFLGACSPGASLSSDGGSVRSTGDRVTLQAKGHPRAVIAVDGSLSIGGDTVEVTEEQRALLRSYHTELNGMTADGIAIGKEGAKLAGKAVSAAIQGAMRGESDKVGAQIEADAELIARDAMRICRRLLVVKESQDQLAASLPAFAPYATIRMDDIGDCTGEFGDKPAGDGSPDASEEAAAATSERVAG